MNKRMILGCLLSVSVGCGGGGGGMDSGPVGGDDAGPDTNTGPVDSAVCANTDAGMQVMPSTALTIQMGTPVMAVPGDLTCLGTATRPAGGAATAGVLTVTEFLPPSAPTASTMVDIFSTNVITDTCAAPDCMTVTTDSMGQAMATLPAGAWTAFHIHQSAATAEVLAYSFPWTSTAGGTVGTNSFSSSTVTLVSTLLQRMLQTTTAGAISGQVNDCMGHHLQNAEARVFHGTTQIVDGPACNHASPRITGLEGTSLTRDGLTGPSGTFVGANVPVGDDYHVEIWGVTTAGSAPRLVGCEEGRVVAGGITVLSIGPLRSDYVAGSACATAAAAAH